MTMGHFPPVSGKCQTWLVDIFLPFLKSVTYDNGTISSHFWKVSHMTIGHFTPVSEKCHIWPWDIFLPFLKSVTEKYGTFSSHFRTGGKCPIVMCYTFQKQEANVHYLCVTIFWNGRKMSHSHLWSFSEMGGKCPLVICDTNLKQEENVC